MKRIGLTGGIGSGKSTVAKIFEIAGIPVYNADRGAAKLMQQPAVISEIISHFSPDIQQRDGQIDRKKLAKIVFQQPEALQWLNALLHPLVQKDFIEWSEQQRNVPFVMMEAAILFEAGFAPLFDQVITVYAPPEVCLQRVMQRDGATAEQVQERMKNQLSPEEKRRLADYTIINDGVQAVLPQVLYWCKSV